MISTTHSSSLGTSCLSYQRRTDEILGRKIGFPRLDRGKKEKLINILTGVGVTLLLWAAVWTIWGFWLMIGGR
jgi:hypothetical protein